MALPPPPGKAPSPGELTENETMIIMRSELRPEHREDPNVLRFIQEYMRCRHAGQAGRDAGLSPQSGHALRKRPDIHRCIEKLTAKSVQKYGYDASEIIERAKEISDVDPIEIENDDGTYKERMSDIAPEVRRAIKKMTVKNCIEKDLNGMDVITGRIIAIEFYDKLQTHKWLGQEKNVFKDKKEVTHDVGSNMAAVLLESRKRAEDAFGDLIDVTPQLGEGKGNG